ncbi:MAG: ABC transporter substrate-binding protein [bacterium]|nr:ABC transporter substrate-binding protein [bacterium]
MDFGKKPKVKQVSSAKKIISKPQNNPEKRILPKIDSKNITQNLETAEKLVINHTQEFLFDKFPNLKNVRNLVLVWLFLMGMLLLSVAAFRIFGQRNYMAETFVGGGTYSEGIVGEINNLNPLFASSEPEKAFSKLAFSRLYEIDTSGKLNTELAQNISTSSDYQDFKLKIRENATWSDGEKLTVDDVIFTINLLKNRTVNAAGYASWSEVKVSKISDFEMRFETPTASKLVLYTLDFPVLPKHKLENVQVEKIREDNFSKSPITSGIFNFKSVSQSQNNTTILLEKNQNYFKGKAKLDRFEIVAYQQKKDLVQALGVGEISASPDVDLSDFPEETRALLNENQSKINHGIYAFLNNSSDILKNKSVRQAIQKGVDIEKVRSKMDSISALDFPIPAEYLNANELEAPKYNQAEAANILEEAGWKLENGKRQKDGVPLKITIATIDEPNLDAAAQEFKTQLQALGFEIELLKADAEDKSGSFVQSVLQPRNYDILIYQIDLGADFDIYAFWHSAQANSRGLNLSNFSDAVADDTLVNSRSAEAETFRKEQLTAFSKRWLNQAAAIGIAQVHSNYVYRKSVQTYSLENNLAESLNRYSDALYWQVNKSELYKTP